MSRWLWALVLTACSGPSRAPDAWSGGGLSIHVARGAAERWRLSSASVDIEVDGPSPRVGRRAGRVRRMSLRGDPAPRLRYLAFRLEVGGRMHNLEDVTVRTVDRGGRPALRIAGIVVADEREFRLATEIHLDPARPIAKIRTRVTRIAGPAGGRVRIADVLDWGGVSAFVPGVGLLSNERRLSAPWIARAGLRSPYAVVAKAGPLGVWLRSEPHGISDLVLYGPMLEDGTATYERHVVLAAHGLSEVAALAWSVARTPFHRITGSVIGPLQGVEVLAVAQDGAIEAVATPDPDGTFELAVRPGAYRVVAEGSAGGADTMVDAQEDTRVVLEIPDGGRLRIEVTDEGDDPLPARVIVVGIAPTPWPNLGPHWRADGAEHSICLADGPAEIPLLPGRYRLTATHGPEWSIDSRDVAVPAGRTTRARLKLAREVDTGGLVAGDFHLHASPSADSLVSLPDRVRSLVCEGVEIAVPTDHNHVTDYNATIASLGVGGRLATASGVEITSGGPYWGHFNAYPVDRSGGPMPFPFLETTPAAIFGAVRARFPNAIVQVNHPRMGSIGYFELMGLDPATGQATQDAWSPDFDAIEVWNGLDLHHPERTETNLEDWMQLLTSGLRYTAMGNSDSHKIHSQWIGYPRSYLRLPSDDPTAVRAADVGAAVRSGRVMVTNGPVLDVSIGEAGPGDVVRAQEGRVTVRVRLQAARWIDTKDVELLVGGEVRERWTVPDRSAPGLRGEWTAEVAVDRRTYVLAIARGEHPLDAIQPGRTGPPMAFTNPIWVEPSAPRAGETAR